MAAPRHTKPLPLLTQGVGINNRVAPHRIPFSIESGVGALEHAVDIILDRTGELVTRKGTELLQSGIFHSMYPAKHGFYIAEDRESDTAIHIASVDSLGQVQLKGIWAGLSKGKWLSYFVLEDIVFYANGTQNGVLFQDTRAPWIESEFTDNTTADMVQTPVGNHIEILSGRALVAIDNEIIYSEHGLLGITDTTRNRQRFEHRIVLMCAVQTGVFVSTTEAIYFLSGLIPSKWEIKRVANYPAIEWCREPGLVDPVKLGFKSSHLGVLFGTVEGPVVGLSDGSLHNSINKNVQMPTTCGGNQGSIMTVDDSLIIQSSGV